MRISIVIPTRDRADLLERGLHSLRSEIGDAPDTEIIVVDDGGRPGLRGRIAASGKQYGARIVTHDANRGMAVARNTGWKAARGAWIVFLDDDVCVEHGWYAALRESIRTHDAGDVAGIEGMVLADGNGLWDREVAVTRGGANLTCHIAYRRALLEMTGGFDERFEREGRYCEDQELGARMRRWGPIVFDASLRAVHAARHVRLVRYVMSAPRRMAEQMSAEYWFWRKQPDRYHEFRHRRNFILTYVDTLFKYVAITLRRRPMRELLRRPLQACALITAAIVEQATAWALLPGILFRFLRGRDAEAIAPFDRAKTFARWKLPPATPASRFYLRARPLRSALFSMRRAPVHDCGAPLRRLSAVSALDGFSALLRIDDVFLEQDDTVRTLCVKMRDLRAPFLAAVTGRDCMGSRAHDALRRIADAGGALGLHGFEHAGRFGPYASEVLQLTFPELDRRIDAALRALAPMSMRPIAFVPPFNAIAGEQVRFLARHFRCICGGPESVRFTGRLFGPASIDGNAWFVPSLFPCYQRAAAMLRQGLPGRLARMRGIVCITVHMPDEAADGFASLTALISALEGRFISWETL